MSPNGGPIQAFGKRPASSNWTSAAAIQRTAEWKRGRVVPLSNFQVSIVCWSKFGVTQFWSSSFHVCVDRMPASELWTSTDICVVPERARTWCVRPDGRARSTVATLYPEQVKFVLAYAGWSLRCVLARKLMLCYNSYNLNILTWGLWIWKKYNCILLDVSFDNASIDTDNLTSGFFF